ncbi:mitochondrial inner membrane protease subunit 2 isoform X13 [Rhineura floridana]|uniref:mitochondrial inner membrane protease subunit 2 isoform X13 n=1 Tax=Rhineura floridana TaxID=261503 RepID=UPI002AC86337|nr:mitochondrial inner membrane protease subunit 2 isoform X13 [Rhineura floridana]
MRRGGERARARARACAYFSSPPSLVWRQRRKAMMAQTQGFGRRYIKAFLKGFFVAVPVTVTFLDRVACIARVEGASMQPSLNPGGRQVSDVVLLNHWSIRNYEVQRGDIVSLVYVVPSLCETPVYKKQILPMKSHLWIKMHWAV